MRSTSLIITTYNWPEALDLVLSSVVDQSRLPDTVLIADDGSGPRTKALITDWQRRFPCPLRHIWQPDEGFRASRIRNLAAAKTNNSQLIFIDGDCLLPTRFIEHHQNLMHAQYFVAGNRVLLSKDYTKTLLQTRHAVWQDSFWRLASTARKGGCNRLLPRLYLPLGPLRYLQPERWQGVKTCNLSVARKDFFKVNGFDESFVGWGYEDSDLVVRLIKSGVRRKEGRFSVPVLHLWHPEQAREHQQQNWEYFQERQTMPGYRASCGVDRHVKKEKQDVLENLD